jgi:hypothetical protein
LLALKPGESGDWVILAIPLTFAIACTALGLLMVKLDRRRQKRKRGFEVKLDTGVAPVAEKKEIDHG